MQREDDDDEGGVVRAGMIWLEGRLPNFVPCILVCSLLFASVAAYSAPCPAGCTCTVAELSCAYMDEGRWMQTQEFLSAPSTGVSILNVTIRGGSIPTLRFLPYVHNLKVLHFSDVRLRRLDFPLNYKYRAMRSLEILSSGIEELDDTAFMAFPKLEHLSLRNNSISHLKHDYLRVVNLRSLDLSNNRLETVSGAFRRLTSLESLDLSGNQLKMAKSSDFQFQQQLRTLNLSHNSITHFNFDLFGKNVRIEEIDLSYNNLTESPGADLKQFVNLLILNVSGNPIATIPAWNFEFDRLQMMVANRMPSLKVIESGAFSKSRDLRQLDLSHNYALAYISGTAFENCSAIHLIDLTNSTLKVLYANNLKDVAQVRLAGGDFNCECMAREVEHISATTVDDWSEVVCVNNHNESIRLSSARVGDCPPAPILAEGDVVSGVLGTTEYIYCAARSEGDYVFWTLPNGTVLPGLEPLTTSSTSKMDYFANTLLDGGHYIPDRPRIYASREWLRLDVVTPWDAGEYLCTVQRAADSSLRATKNATARIRFNVVDVPIDLQFISSGAHHISLAWNDSLHVQAYDRVVQRILVIDRHGNKMPILHSLHNPWNTYNVMRLQAERNFTICLEYALAEEPDHALLSTCVQAWTQAVVPLWGSIPSEVLLTLLAIFSLTVAGLIGRHIWYRVHVWQQAKYRSRLNQSISGQSIVSHSSSNSNAVTYENQQIALCRVPSAVDSRSFDPSTTRLLNSDVPV